MDPVSVSWARIDAWLARHTPVSRALLAGPADPAGIAGAEAALGLTFPAELVESLGCHDGLVAWGNIMPEHPPLAVAAIVAHWRMCMEIADDVNGFEPREPHGEPWWHPLWVPFGESEGDALVIDLRPGPGHGRLGWAVHDGTGDFSEAWPSLAAYLAATADALTIGGEVGGWYPYLTVDGELWWSLSGETELNGKPLRPAPTDEARPV